MGGSGIAAICDMRGVPCAVGQAVRSDLQADICGVQLVAARCCAGVVGIYAACHVCNLDMQWLHHTQTLAGLLLYCVCYSLYMGLYEDAPSLPPAFRQGI